MFSNHAIYKMYINISNQSFDLTMLIFLPINVKQNALNEQLEERMLYYASAGRYLVAKVRN